MKQLEKYNLSGLELLIRQKFGDVVLYYKDEESPAQPPAMTFVSSEKKGINHIVWRLSGIIKINDEIMSCEVSLIYDTPAGQNESEYPILSLVHEKGIWKIV